MRTMLDASRHRLDLEALELRIHEGGRRQVVNPQDPTEQLSMGFSVSDRDVLRLQRLGLVDASLRGEFYYDCLSCVVAFHVRPGRPGWVVVRVVAL